MRDGVAVDGEREAASVVVVSAGGVEGDGEKVAMVGERVDGEVCPGRGCERVEDDAVVGAGAEADEAGDERVGEPGVVVVVAAADLLVLGEEHVLGDPLAGVGVVVFVDPVDGAAAR